MLKKRTEKWLSFISFAYFVSLALIQFFMCNVLVRKKKQEAKNYEEFVKIPKFRCNKNASNVETSEG